MLGTASRAWPKNSRAIRCVWAATLRCTTQRALVIRPSQPLSARRVTAQELVGHVLAQTSFAQTAARDIKVLTAQAGLPLAAKSSSKLASGRGSCPRLWLIRVTSSHSPAGVTMRHDAKLSKTCPEYGFLPPAFMAMLPRKEY